MSLPKTKITPTRFVSIRLTDAEFKLLKDESLSSKNTLNTVVRNLIKNCIKSDNQNIVFTESLKTNDSNNVMENQFLNQSVDYLELTVRSENGIKAVGIKTVADLKQ